MRLLLAFRALTFVVLLPGTVAGYIPFRLLRGADQLHAPRLSASSLGAVVLLLAGTAVLLRCVWDFFAAGQGTLAPVHPPKHLVVRGLYRFTRNPMYNGVVAMLLGEAWLFGSLLLVKYALLVFLLFHLFVVLYEEHTLESRFGETYRLYRKAVPRWGFRVRPCSGNTETNDRSRR
jgi:protein-S-isoprenylcysteine O-methyltransferase Ste14